MPVAVAADALPNKEHLDHPCICTTTAESAPTVERLCWWSFTPHLCVVVWQYTSLTQMSETTGQVCGLQTFKCHCLAVAALI